MMYAFSNYKSIQWCNFNINSLSKWKTSADPDQLDSGKGFSYPCEWDEI